MKIFIISAKLLSQDYRVFRTNTAVSPEDSKTLTVEIDFGEAKKFAGKGRHWKTSVANMLRVNAAERLDLRNSPTRMFRRYLADLPVIEFNNIWTDTRSEQGQQYVVQTASTVIERCLLMTTDPGDLVLDPTCGGERRRMSRSNGADGGSLLTPVVSRFPSRGSGF
jgi:adenine-specific DNA-methyltransferase